MPWIANPVEVTDAALGVLAKLIEAVGSLRRGREEQDEEKSLARLVYWEVAYNAIVVDLCRQLMPVRLLAARHEWDRIEAAGAIVRLLPSEQLPIVASPYLELETFHRLTFEPHPGRIAMRFQGADRDGLAGLAQRFRAAEQTLRPHLFNATQRKRLEEAWEAHKPLDLKPMNPLDRVAAAATAVPPWFWFATLGWLASSRLGDIEGAIRKRESYAVWRRIRRGMADGLARLL